MIIKSSKNPLFKKLVSLTKSKGVKEDGHALVSGEKITREISESSPNCFWVMTEGMIPPRENFDRSRTVIRKDKSTFLFSEKQGKAVYLSKELFHELDVCGTGNPLLCCQYEKPKSFSDLDLDMAVLYVAVSDPGNLGALVRSCAAFCWPQIVLLSESTHPFLPKTIRSSGGTVFKTNFFEGPSINNLFDPRIVALDKNGKVFSKEDLKKDIKLLVGEEGQGIPESFKGKKLSIPISDKVESLNVTVATSLIIYEWNKLLYW